MEISKVLSAIVLVLLVACAVHIEARHNTPVYRPQYKVNDAEAAASDWSGDYDDRPRRHYHGDGGGGGVTGPIHTFVKTDKNANYKWGVRHHVGHKYT